MRPVTRGDAPSDSYRHYREAKPDLEDRLGRYCSYCERPILASLHVEHKKPKSKFSELKLEWDNFLLACANCNSSKGDEDVDDKDILWPDRDNTLLALEYSRGGFVRANENLSAPLQKRARKLLELTDLDRPPKKRTDRRWEDRNDAWKFAKKFLRHYQSSAEVYPEFFDFMIDTAVAKGFFSVWLTVFEQHPKVKRELIKNFPGTAESCFDEDGNLQPRPGGAI